MCGVCLVCVACAPPTEERGQVAAIQYTPGFAGEVAPACVAAPAPDLCAMERLVREAARGGAELIVLPEYGLERWDAVPEPDLRSEPGRDAAAAGPVARLSRLARQERAWLFVNLLTTPEPSTGAWTDRTYNSLIAFSSDGQVRAIHHKFELFAEEEATLTPGDDVTVVETPLGRVGMLVCADLYGDLRLHARLHEELEVELVVVSAWWTAAGAPRWPQSYAHDWQVPVIAANTVEAPGAGGGIFDATGRVLAESDAIGVVRARLPSR